MADTNDDAAPAPVELDAFTAELAAQGFAIDGGYPANHRLRAEALVADGKDADPDGIVTPELIASTGERVKAEAAEAETRERAAADAEAAAPNLKWSEKRLRDEAARRGVTVESDANKAAILAAIEAAPAAGTEG